MSETIQTPLEDYKFKARRIDYGSDSDNPAFQGMAEFVEENRRNMDIVTPEGGLDTEKKFEKSAYEILNLNYFKENIMYRQAIPSTIPDEYPTDELYRETLVMHTQHLISQIVKSENPPGTLFFLDKSARPVAWMVQKLWPLFVDDETHHIPEIKFIDIDINRLFGRDSEAPRPTPEEIYDWKPNKKQLTEIRAIYERGGKKLDRHPEQLGKAWVIDEVSVSNGSAMVSQQLLEKAFPGLKVESKIWMPTKKIKTSSGATVPTQLAPWYSKDFIEGRGVGETGSNSFLSGHGKHDILTEALRTDIDLLAKDIKEGKQSIRPIIGCYEINPETGEEDPTRPKYRVAKFVKGKRVLSEPIE
jgi:hypothetical protein